MRFSSSNIDSIKIAVFLSKAFSFKIILFTFFFTANAGYLQAQRPAERVETEWPEEYNWQVAGRLNSGNKQTIYIIPGNETPGTASIIGSIVAFKGLRYSSINEIIIHYKQQLDSGSTLTLVTMQDSARPLWVIFKVETPATTKYPEPESDLYYVIQGEYALFEDHVAIKQPNLSQEFINKWSKIFKNSRLVKE
jgi:hypothetical protein